MCSECGCHNDKHKVVFTHYVVCSGKRKACWACVIDLRHNRFASVVQGYNDSQTLLKERDNAIAS